MSGGVNVKSAPKAPPPSGIPLPHSLLPSSSKAGTHHRASDLPRPSKHTPKHTPTQTPTHSPSLCLRSSSIPTLYSRDPTREPRLKSHLLKRSVGLPAPQESRSAYSSPLTQRRVLPPHSKDTLDLRKPTPPHTHSQFPHDGNRNRSTFTNNNQTWGTSNLHPTLQFSRGHNPNPVSHATTEVVPQRGAQPPENRPAHSDMLNNRNLHPCLVQTSHKHAIGSRNDSTSQSDEEMGTPEEYSPASSPGPLPLPLSTFTMAIMSKMSVNRQDPIQSKESASTETHTPSVNMAAVAPFSYRVQVQENDLSLDELSDCSSGSIEVCCDDLTPVSLT